MTKYQLDLLTRTGDMRDGYTLVRSWCFMSTDIEEAKKHAEFLLEIKVQWPGAPWFDRERNGYATGAHLPNQRLWVYLYPVNELFDNPRHSHHNPDRPPIRVLIHRNKKTVKQIEFQPWKGMGAVLDGAEKVLELQPQSLYLVPDSTGHCSWIDRNGTMWRKLQIEGQPDIEVYVGMPLEWRKTPWKEGTSQTDIDDLEGRLGQHNPRRRRRQMAKWYAAAYDANREYEHSRISPWLVTEANTIEQAQKNIERALEVRIKWREYTMDMSHGRVIGRDNIYVLLAKAGHKWPGDAVLDGPVRYVNPRHRNPRRLKRHNPETFTALLIDKNGQTIKAQKFPANDYEQAKQIIEDIVESKLEWLDFPDEIGPGWTGSWPGRDSPTIVLENEYETDWRTHS